MKFALYKIILAVLIGVAISGCSKFLEEYPEYEMVGENAIVDERSALQALNGVYGYLQLRPFAGVTYSSGTMSYNILEQPALYAGLLTYNGTNAFYAQLNALSINPTITTLNTYYGDCYKIVNAANNVIFYVNRLSSDKVSTEMKADIVSEATFLRGLGHFWLLRAYGYFWDEASPYGVVVREEATNYSNHLQARSTVATTYEKIIADFEYCAENGPVVQASRYKASRNLAKAFLMETLLLRGRTDDLQNVIRLGDDIINSGEYQLEATFADVFNPDKPPISSSELMFSRPIVGEQIAQMLGSGGAILGKYHSGVSTVSLRPADLSFGIYADILSNDERYPYTWGERSVMLGNPPTERKGLALLKAWRPDANIFSFMMRLPQVYFMKAEALLNDGAPLGDVINIINLFRIRSGNEPLTVEDVNGDRSLLREQLVYDYILELGLENGSEYAVLVRNRGADGARMLNRFNGNFSDDSQLAFPIPYDETARDEGIVIQNP